MVIGVETGVRPLCPSVMHPGHVDASTWSVPQPTASRRNGSRVREPDVSVVSRRHLRPCSVDKTHVHWLNAYQKDEYRRREKKAKMAIIFKKGNKKDVKSKSIGKLLNALT